MYILKNRFLNTASFLFDKPNDGGGEDLRTDAQKQRDSIQVNDSVDVRNDKTDNDTKSDDDKSDDNTDEDDENKDENEDDENADDVDEDNEDEDEDEEKEEVKETEEEIKARERKERKEARQQRKWDKLASEKTIAENRVKELEAKLKETPVDGLTEEEVNRRARELADQELNKNKQDSIQEQFNKDCADLEKAAIKADKEFIKKMDATIEEVGKLPGEMIAILADLDNKNGGAVLSHLMNDVDAYEEMYDLRGSPVKLAIRLTRLSDTIKAAEKPRGQRRSSAPDPITPIKEGGRPNNTMVITGKESMDEFVAKRARQEEEKRKVRRY